MVLTNQESIRDPDKFPTLQLFLLGTSSLYGMKIMQGGEVVIGEFG
jgi:hypothetical protein